MDRWTAFQPSQETQRYFDPTQTGWTHLECQKLTSNKRKLPTVQLAEWEIKFNLAWSTPNIGERKRVPKETQHLLHKWGSSFLERNRILRQCKGTRVQSVVPNKLRSLILIELHEKMGHLGFHHSQDGQSSAFIGLTCRELMKIILIMSVSVQNGAPDTKEQGAATARLDHCTFRTCRLWLSPFWKE